MIAQGMEITGVELGVLESAQSAKLRFKIESGPDKPVTNRMINDRYHRGWRTRLFTQSSVVGSHIQQGLAGILRQARASGGLTSSQGLAGISRQARASVDLTSGNS